RASKSYPAVLDQNRFLWTHLWAAVIAAAFSRIPGPIVVLSEPPFRYVPFAVAGFARRIVSRIVLTLSRSFLASNEAFPIGTCTMPAFSTRNSTLPAF